MKIYCVFGVEYHVSSTLIGVYDSQEKVEVRIVNADSYGYDLIEWREIELNEDIDE